MTTVKYSFDEFVHDMTQLVESQPDQEKLFDVGSTYLEKLILNPEGIPEELRTPTGKGPITARTCCITILKMAC